MKDILRVLILLSVVFLSKSESLQCWRWPITNHVLLHGQYLRVCSLGQDLRQSSRNLTETDRISDSVYRYIFRPIQTSCLTDLGKRVLIDDQWLKLCTENEYQRQIQRNRESDTSRGAGRNYNDRNQQTHNSNTQRQPISRGQSQPTINRNRQNHQNNRQPTVNGRGGGRNYNDRNQHNSNTQRQSINRGQSHTTINRNRQQNFQSNRQPNVHGIGGGRNYNDWNQHNSNTQRQPISRGQSQTTINRNRQVNVFDCLNRNRAYQNDQWYLNPALGKPNLNVYDVWRGGITGSGIVIGVVDAGIYPRPELPIRNDLLYSHNIQQVSAPETRTWRWGRVNGRRIRVYDSRPQNPTMPSHGTRVAGVIASKPQSCNQNTPVGIAFGAEIADLRSLPSSFSRTVDLGSLDARLDAIHIFSCSFTNIHTGFTTYPLPNDIKQSLYNGITNGRVGKGAIYVWATGNSGGDGFGRDSCAYDGYVNNPYVIPVAGVSHNKKPIESGEECSAIMVSAFTRDPAVDLRRYGISTLDGQRGITKIFGENSAAVPMVSGVIALLLEANMDLTYRDVMHLLVRTSRSRGFFSPNDLEKYFTVNAAGHTVSSTFGFGVIDASALVREGRNWQRIPEQRRYQNQYMRRQDRLNRTSNNYFIICGTTNLNSLEHVEVRLNYTAVNGGQIQWRLVSPGGTSSTILPGRNLDVQQNVDISVISNQFWDENPTGQWRLSAVIADDFHDGTLNSWSLTMYGYYKN